MNPKQEFKQAQKDYKDVRKSIENLNAKYAKEHENFMRDISQPKSNLLHPSKIVQALRPTKEALKEAEKARREASHKLIKALNKDFRKSNQTLQENKGEKSKEELLDEIADMDADSLIDFTEEEAAEWESKYGMNNPSKGKPEDTPELPPTTPNP